MRDESSPARIPLWILILRMLIAAAVIVAMAGPVYAPEKAHSTSKGPLALFVETGWPVAEDWDLRIRILTSLINEAQQAERPILLIASQEGPEPTDLLSPSAALEKLRALTPLSYRPHRDLAFEKLGTSLAKYPDAELVLALDGFSEENDARYLAQLVELAKSHTVRILEADTAHVMALAGAENSADGLKLRVLRSTVDAEKNGNVIAYDVKGRSLGKTPFLFKSGESQTQALISLPTDLRNDISRIEIAGSNSSGAVYLVDDSQKRRRIGLVSGSSADIEQPLLTPNYYLSRALETRADLREPRQGIAESISTLLDENVAILILADIGALPPDIEARMQAYLEKGGTVVRFAGQNLASSGTTLLPVRLRGTGRALQGALSWEKPQKLNPFETGSPFFGLTVPDDVTISRQLLAEPDSDLAKKTWAALTDGTPIVTADRRGKGYLVLFHITADTSWSSLPLSGLYLSLFERLLPLATSDRRDANSNDDAAPLQPRRILDGFGHFMSPPVTAKPVITSQPIIASLDHPAGFYGDIDAPFAINSLNDKSELRNLDVSKIQGEIIPLSEPKRIDFAPALLILAAVLMTLDGMANLIRGRGQSLMRAMRLSSVILFGIFILTLSHPDAHAAQSDMSTKDIDGALKTRLAYVLTDDASVNEISRQGLEGLSRILNERTSFEPADPIGVDLKYDDLAVYPLLYWPITADQQIPPQDAIRRIDRFMKNGGTILFDTCDAALTRDGDPTPETTRLRMILAGLSIPPLEPLPSDHVLTKAFYLIDRIVGRTANGQTWLEALPKSQNNDGPVRSGDGVSQIIITSNDLAAAWAMDQRGGGLLPIDSTMPRQREMALRGGVNIVMYVLTGNYKADQVHVPALLERLGQ